MCSFENLCWQPANLTCHIINMSLRVVGIYNKLSVFTITFRPFTLVPGGFEFLPGHNYYSISTFSKDRIYGFVGEWCATYNMNVIFKVCWNKDKKTLSSLDNPYNLIIVTSTTNSSSIKHLIFGMSFQIIYFIQVKLVIT